MQLYEAKYVCPNTGIACTMQMWEAEYVCKIKSSGINTEYQLLQTLLDQILSSWLFFNDLTVRVRLMSIHKSMRIDKVLTKQHYEIIKWLFSEPLITLTSIIYCIHIRCFNIVQISDFTMAFQNYFINM